MTVLVLDAYASVDLLLETPVRIALEAKLPPQVQRWVPEHCFAEVANAPRRGKVNGYVTTARAATAFNRLSTSPIRRAQIRPLLSDEWTKPSHLTIAGALYVALAERLHATLVTTDVRLARSPGFTVATITA
ncbi:MAG: type II toxin-antitoxin system VapC family toxin [Actinobacteria bacterium]|nr:type II toxin-antitoxin system VapC family toxin [Actinomycetota bacterium]